MKEYSDFEDIMEVEEGDSLSAPQSDLALSRRSFVQVLGAGLLLTITPGAVFAQRAGGGRRGGGGGGGGGTVLARIHLGEDGMVTVLTGKVELGQGARAELSQAAAEELHLPAAKVQAIMADTSLVPDDGTTAGSGTTPRTVPAVRQGAAAARVFLTDLACKRWGVERDTVTIADGVIRHEASQRTLTYADLAKSGDAAKVFEQPIPPNLEVTPPNDWKVLGSSVPRPNRRDLVTGAHLFPSDIVRPNMGYGKVLRPPSYGAKLNSIDLSPAKAMSDVVVVQEDQFVGVVAPTTFQAAQALRAIAKTASWTPAPHPSSKEIFAYLKEHARGDTANPFAGDLAQANKVLRQTYHAAYIQHAPMETRTALAEWEGDKLTVWTSTQAPFGYHNQLASTFSLPSDRVRVIVPDIGGGFGGKHTGEAAVEAARLARAAKRPVKLKWTREEEFTWAYFRPAAVIEIEASLDANGKLATWHFVNINSGGSAVDTPYRLPKAQSRFVQSSSPLRTGSYRALASTANNFARECFMDELAAAAAADPLEFRLAHLENPRLRAVLETAAKRFDWATKKKNTGPDIGVGLACGTEKGSVVAACAEVAVNREQGTITVRHICEVFECGAVLNPDNLLSQVHGCIIMGLGGALREEMQFEDGKMLNANFTNYLVPRFKDVPELDIHFINRPDLAMIGAGETPIIPVAPAIANAVFHACGIRLRQMPLRLTKTG